MAFDGSGTFARLYDWTDDRDAGVKIRADRMDSEMDGMATGLSTCITKNGQTTITANLPMAGFRHTGVGNGSARNDYAALGQVQDGSVNWVAAGGTADALTAAYTPTLTAVANGMILATRAASANATTTPTFSPDGLTARTIVKEGGAALRAGDIAGANHEILLRYMSASTRWELLNPATDRLAVNAQTGTTYTVLLGDYHKLITFSNGSAIAVTLPQATGNFAAKWFCWVKNLGAGTVTITPTTSTINGAATLVLLTGMGALIVSDGTNYQAVADQAGSATLSGLLELATDAETVTGTDTARATTPANITARLAAPGAIGGTTAAAGTFTTLTANTRAFIGDTADTNVTQGLTINQGENDDSILTLKSSDIAHGVTDVFETDTYGAHQKVNATAGGYQIDGVIGGGNGTLGLLLQGTGDTSNTTHTAAGTAFVEARAYKKSGTGRGAADADANLFAVRSTTTTRFIVDLEGDLFADGSDVTVYDRENDIVLLNAFDYLRADGGLRHDMRGYFGREMTRWIELEGEAKLIELGVLGGRIINVPKEKRGLICVTQLLYLNTGAIRQSWLRMNDMDDRLGTVEVALPVVESRVAQLERRVEDLERMVH